MLRLNEDCHPLNNLAHRKTFEITATFNPWFLQTGVAPFNVAREAKSSSQSLFREDRGTIEPNKSMSCSIEERSCCNVAAKWNEETRYLVGANSAGPGYFSSLNPDRRYPDVIPDPSSLPPQPILATVNSFSMFPILYDRANSCCPCIVFLAAASNSSSTSAHSLLAPTPRKNVKNCDHRTRT